MPVSKNDVKEGDMIVAHLGIRAPFYVFFRVLSFTKTGLPRVAVIKPEKRKQRDETRNIIFTGRVKTMFIVNAASCVDGEMHVLRQSERYTVFPEKVLSFQGYPVERFYPDREYAIYS